MQRSDSPQEGNVSPVQSYTTSWAPQARTRRRMPRRLGFGVVALVLVSLAACSPGISSGKSSGGNGLGSSSAAPTVSVPASASDLQQTVVNVIHTVEPSVVEVDATTNQGEQIGSGEVLTADGYIVTNDHVVAGANSFKVKLSNGNTVSATVRGTSPADDLAVLKVNASNLQPIAIGDSSKVEVGQFAIAVGSPLGYSESATFGIISALDRTATEAPSGPANNLTGLIQTSAPINPGNSGGALVDLQGKLIGIPTLGAVNTQSGTAANGIGFAIPSNRVQFVAQQLIQNGHLTNTGEGFLGIQAEDVTPQLAQANNLSVSSGVLIAAFANDASGKSPAQQAGLQTGDVITAVNGHTVTGQADLSSILLQLKPGTKVTVTVVRNGNQLTKTVTLGERPTTAG